MTTSPKTLVSSPLIENCYFAENVAGGPGGLSYASGGAIGLADFQTTAKGGKAEVRHCIFVNNTANSRGGGVFGSCNNNAIIDNCLFTANRANNGTAHNGGSEIFMSLNSVFTVTNCRIYGNTSPGTGGAVKFFNVTDPVFTNNIVAENSGGGLSGCVNAGSFGVNCRIKVTNCILWKNGTREVAPAGTDKNGRPPFALITYSDVAGGFTGTGNINADPLLANIMNGNHRLLYGSPCVDKGSDTAPAVPKTDFEGDIRPINTTGDMGADEYDPKAILLWADVATISASNGGSPKFSIKAPAGFANQLNLLLPGFSGSEPGLNLGNVHLPLNVDHATLVLLPAPGLWGTVDSTGKARKTVVFAGNLPPAVVGLEMTIASLLIGGGNFTGASNPGVLAFVR